MKSKFRLIFLICAGLILVPSLVAVFSVRRYGALRVWPLLLLQLLSECVGLWVVYRKLLMPVMRLNETVSAVLGSSELENATVEGNSLLDRFQALMDQEYASRISSREAELDALQSQMNPHFLYNTLECIRGQAVVEGANAIAEMAWALSGFFRYSINRKEKLVLLTEEFQNVNAYIKIQNYRFSNRYHLRVHMDEKDRPIMERCQIPRLTLQPIIENALLHGVRDSEREVEYLDVFVELTESRLLLKVTDYGVGIPQEKLDQINGELWEPTRAIEAPVQRSGNGIALRNINERIQLIFGQSYGLRVSSTVGVGCTVEVVLPKRIAKIREN